MELMSGAGLFRDVAFLLLHHPRKETSQDELDEVSGAWGGKPDTMLRLEKLDGNRGRLPFPKIRWSRLGTRKALILGFDPETESFSVVAEEEDEERDYAAEIEELLADGTWRINQGDRGTEEGRRHRRQRRHDQTRARSAPGPLPIV
jgi:hypothetical protein